MTTASHQSARPYLRGSVAVVILLALLVVPPVLLVTFGVSPIPAHAPDGDAVVKLLRSPLSDTAVLRVVTAVAWLAWLHLCACVVAEVGAQLRGWQVRVPFGGVNRRLAAHLVAVAVLAVHGGAVAGSAGVLTRAAAVAYPLAPATISTSTSAIDLRPAHESAPVPFAAATVAVGSPVTAHRTTAHLSVKEYVVEPPHGRSHDNLWDIAGRHLGDPLRWREIFALNEGRLMPDGQRLTAANLIQPGWVLRMPADATDVHVVEQATPSPRQASETTARRTTTSAAHEQAAAPRSVPAPVTPVSTPPQSTTETPVGGDRTASTPRDHRDNDKRLPATPIGAAAALSAAGVLVVLARRRRVAARRRPLGTRPAPLPAQLIDSEALLYRDAKAGAALVDTVRACARLAAARNPAVAVRAVLQHHDGTLDVIVTPMSDAPAPFTRTDHGWRLAPSEHGYLLAVDTPLGDPVPLLVPVGAVEDATCYVNLETARTISVVGEDTITDRFIAGVGQSIAGAPWSELTQVVVPQRLAEAAAGRERIDIWQPPSPLLDHLSVYAQRVATTVGAAGSLDAARRRGDDGDVALILLAGLRGSDIPDALREQLHAPGGPLVALLNGEDPDGQPWRIDAQQLRIPGIDADIRPHLVDSALVTRTAELLEHVTAAQPVGADDEVLQPLHDECPPDSAERAVAVNVLGPVEINGNGTAKRAGVRDLAVYLALHRRAIAAEVLATTVWPDREFNADLLRTRMSETRRLLDCGIVHEGRTWRMTETVGCDWQRFQALVDGDEDDRRRALELVRGRPFEGYDREWVQLEGFDRHIEAAIVDVALEVGQRALDRDDPVTATWAANVGISACPYDERLYRLGMRAAAARGASGEARNLLNALRGVLDEQVEPDDRIEPETLAEFDRAIRSQRAG